MADMSGDSLIVAAAVVVLIGSVALLTVVAALAAALEPIQKSIEDLRRVQYEQQGQRAAQTENKGSTQWVAAFAVTLLFLVLAMAGFVATLATR